MQHIFVTNTDSSFGLGLVQHYAQRGAHVFAACPQPDRTAALQQICFRYPGAITPLQLDMINRDHIAAAFETVRARTSVLDILINNTEMNRKLLLDSLENASYAFRMYAIAPIMIARRLTPLLLSSACPRIINLASTEAIPSPEASPQIYTTNTGRQALKLYTQALAAELRSDGIHVMMMELGCLQSGLIATDDDLLRRVVSTTVKRITDEIDALDVISIHAASQTDVS